MPSQKISQLPVASTTTANDLYPLVQSGVNYAIKFSSLQTAIFSALTSSQLPAITLTGDVTGSGIAGSIPTSVQSVGGASAANIAAAVSAYLAATSSNTPSTLVKRDSSGNFSAGTITAALTGAASANVLKTGDTMSGDLNMGGNNIDNVTNIFGEQRLFTTNVVRVKKNPGYGEFSSIAAAIASVTTASSSNPFFIEVGPGVYTEPQLVMKPYVYVGGLDFESTIIQPSNPAAHLVVGADNSAIFKALLTGVTGSGQALVYYSSNTGTLTTAFWIEDVRFGASDTLAIADGTNGYTSMFINSCRFGGPYQFNTGFVARTIGPTYGRIVIRNSTSTKMSAPYPVDMFVCDGAGCEISPKSVAARTGLANAGGNGIRLRNGGTLRSNSLDIEGFSKGLWAENVGAAPTIVGGIITFLNNTQDIQVDHPGTSGGLAAGANDDLKVYVNPAATNFGYIIIGLEDGDILISGKLKQAQPDGTPTDITTLTTNATPVGLLTLGDISPPFSGTTVTVDAGFGYLQKSDGSLHKIMWPDTPITVPNNVTNWLYFDSTGTLQQNGTMPDVTQNIVVGRVVTGTGKIFLVEESGFLAIHAAGAIGTALRNGLGAVFATGSTVAEVSTRELSITAGEYYYGERQFLSQGANPALFTSFYENGSGGFNNIALQTTVDNANYDNGTGTLAPITAGFYAKHSLYMIGDASGDFDSETYYLVYAQAQYNALTLAEQAALPNPPNFLSGGATLIASLIVSPGTTNIVEIRDERPIIASKRISTVAATSFHHNLLGLNDFDDHLRYLPVDGSRPMTGDLPMGTHNVTNAGTYNGVTVENHHARHQPGSGLDELPTAAAATLTPDQANTVGTSTSLSRADHIHNVPTATAVGLNAGSTNTQGVAATFSRSDHTHAIASGTPSTQTPNQSNSAGVSTNLARADHIHDIPTGTPSTLNATNTNTQGTAAAFAQQDHLHAISTGTPSTQTPNQVNATGVSSNLARADHIHDIPTGVPSTLTPNAGNSQGVAAAFAQQDHIHNVPTTAPANQTIAAAAADGSASTFSRSDHIHTFSTATPTDVGSANAAGTSTSFIRADHVHKGVHSVKANAGSQEFGDLTLANGNGASVSDNGSGTFTIDTTFGPNELVPTNGGGLVLNYTAGRVRINGTFYSIAAGSLTLGANVTNGRVYVSTSGVVTDGGAISASPPDSVPIALYTTGASTITSLSDHRTFLQHQQVFGLAADIVTITPDATAVGGSTNKYTDAGHTHAIATAAASTQTPNQSNAKGTSTSFARADHVHNIPTGTPSTLNATNANTQGTAAAFAQQDHLHAISTGTPSTQTPDQVNATGVSSNLARADHVHNVPTGVASTISSNANAQGTAAAFARQDHTHQLTAATASLDHFPQYDGSNWQAIFPEAIAPARAYRLFEDWINSTSVGQLNWAAVLTGGASTATTISVDSGHPGVLALTAGNAAARFADVHLGTEMLIGGGTINIEVLVNIQTLTNAAYRFGLGDQTAADHNNGVYFEYNSGVSANWLIKTANGGTRTSTTTSIAVTSGAWHKLVISINAAGTSASFTIDGVSAGSISTNLPAAAVGPNLQSDSLGTTNSTVWIDYFNMYQRFTTSR